MSKSVLAERVRLPGLVTSAGCSLTMPTSRSKAVICTPDFVALTSTLERMGIVVLRSTIPWARYSARFSSSAAMRNSMCPSSPAEETSARSARACGVARTGWCVKRAGRSEDGLAGATGGPFRARAPHPGPRKDWKAQGRV